MVARVPLSRTPAVVLARLVSVPVAAAVPWWVWRSGAAVVVVVISTIPTPALVCCFIYRRDGATCQFRWR